MIYRTIRYKVKPEMLAEAHQAIRVFTAQVEKLESGIESCQAFQQRRSFFFMHLLAFADSKAEEQHRDSLQLKDLVKALYPICDEPPTFGDLKLIAATGGDSKRP